jgi:hypothetical protein
MTSKYCQNKKSTFVFLFSLVTGVVWALSVVIEGGVAGRKGGGKTVTGVARAGSSGGLFVGRKMSTSVVLLSTVMEEASAAGFHTIPSQSSDQVTPLFARVLLK